MEERQDRAGAFRIETQQNAPRDGRRCRAKYRLEGIIANKVESVCTSVTRIGGDYAAYSSACSASPGSSPSSETQDPRSALTCPAVERKTWASSHTDSVAQSGRIRPMSGTSCMPSNHLVIRAEGTASSLTDPFRPTLRYPAMPADGLVL